MKPANEGALIALCLTQLWLEWTFWNTGVSAVDEFHDISFFFHWNGCGQRNHYITVAATRRCLQTWVALFHFRRRSLGKWSTLTSFQLGGNENKNKPRRLNWSIFGSLVWCKAKVWDLKPKKGAKFGAVCPPKALLAKCDTPEALQLGDPRNDIWERKAHGSTAYSDHVSLVQVGDVW